MALLCEVVPSEYKKPRKHTSQALPKPKKPGFGGFVAIPPACFSETSSRLMGQVSNCGFSINLTGHNSLLKTYRTQLVTNLPSRCQLSRPVKCPLWRFFTGLLYGEKRYFLRSSHHNSSMERGLRNQLLYLLSYASLDQIGAGKSSPRLKGGMKNKAAWGCNRHGGSLARLGTPPDDGPKLPLYFAMVLS
jgi:hypothetical protein